MIEGRLFFAQPAKGYRFNLDSVILAQSVDEIGNSALDLGAGCGIVGQMLLSFGKSQKVTALELCAEMVELARQSAELNHFSVEQYQVVHADVREIPLPHQQFDLVVCNPPFFKAVNGPMSPNEQRRLARHGAGESLFDWFKAISLMVKPNGFGYMIFPAESLAEIMGAVAQLPLKIVAMRFIYPFSDSPANRVILKMATQGEAGNIKILPPLVTFTAPGVYTSEVLGMLGRTA